MTASLSTCENPLMAGNSVRELRIRDRFVLKLNAGVLFDGNTPVPLGGRALALLCVLAERAPALVTKRELIERVWPTVVVEENNLAAQIASLRRVLGAAAIVTVSGRGYRLLIDHAQAGAAADCGHEDFRVYGSLLERDGALEALAIAHRRLQDAHGGVVLVFGEAGIGKSVLCQQFLNTLDGTRILRGGCEDLFTPRPLGPLHDIGQFLGSGVLKVIGEPNRRSELFAQVMTALGSERTVWLLEDMHWADTATLDLIKYLSRRIAGSSIMLLLTFRDDELTSDHPLRQVLGDLPLTATRVALAPLSERAVTQLAEQAGRTGADSIFAQTRGNPFFVTELLEAGGLPATVRDAVLTRVARQSRRVGELLELISIVPGSIDGWLFEALGSWSEDEVDEALGSGLLSADRGTLAFRHELARLAVLQSVAPHRQRALHQRVLDALENAATTTVEYARHAHHAQAAGNTRKVLDYTPRAAVQAAARGAHRQAAELYWSALQALDPTNFEQRADWLDAHCNELYLAGNPPITIERREEAARMWRALARPLNEGHSLRWLSRQHWSLGHGPQALQYADAAMQLLERFPNELEYGWALSARSQLHMLASAYGQSLALGSEALRIAIQHDDKALLAHALNNMGSARVCLGEESSGLAELERSLAISQKQGFDDHTARALVNLVVMLTALRRYPAALRVHDEANAFFAAHDLDNYRDAVAAWRAELLLEMGRWDEAETVAERLLQSSFPLPRLPALLVRARLAAYRGESHSVALVDRAAELARNTGELQRLVPVAVARAEVQWCSDGCIDHVELRALLTLAHEGASFRYAEDLAFWLWRAAASDNVLIDANSPYGLQIAGRWREAADAWRDLSCPMREAQSLIDGDTDARERAQGIFTRLGASACSARLEH